MRKRQALAKRERALKHYMNDGSKSMGPASTVVVVAVCANCVVVMTGSGSGVVLVACESW